MPDDPHPVSLFLEGSRLDAAAAAQLEAVLAEHPGDLQARARLIGFHTRARSTSADPAALDRHVLWVIGNAPKAELAKQLGGLVSRKSASESNQQMRTLWLEHVRQQPEDLVLLDHAAQFLQFGDPEAAIELIERARGLQPDQVEWTARLAQLHGFGHWRLAGEQRRAATSRAHAEWQRALALAGANDRIDILQDAAWMAFEAGADALARQHAEELLAIAPEHPRSWWHGNAVHKANLVLGRLALRHGDLERAKEHLLAAARIKGSPQLNSFGPNMTLALELLRAGDKLVVLEYFQLCRVFWKSGQDQLERWTAEVEAGTEPQFGPNLAY